MTHLPGCPAASVDPVKKEHAIFERLEHIDGLRREDAPAGVLLDEVRALLAEVEDWVRDEPGLSSRAGEAVARSHAALEAGERTSESALVTR